MSASGDNLADSRAGRPGRVLNIAVHELLHPPWPQGHPVQDTLDALAADPFLAARFAGRDPDAGTTPGPATPRKTRPKRSTSSSIPACDATPEETPVTRWTTADGGMHVLTLLLHDTSRRGGTRNG